MFYFWFHNSDYAKTIPRKFGVTYDEKAQQMIVSRNETAILG